MEVSHWIGQSLAEIENSPLFKKYFTSILLEEEGLDDYFFFNASLGIDIILTALTL